MAKKPTPTNEELQILQQQVADLTEALQRERADVINVRRRHDEQLAGVKKVVKIQVVEELLPVIDNFERALRHVPKDIENNDFVKGVSGIVKQFEKTLTDLGVLKIPTVGQQFDPNLHEAVGTEDGMGENEIIVEELQSGYMLEDTVLRHAMVKVQKQ